MKKRILWIIDNKYREIYGLKSIIDFHSKQNYRIILCHKANVRRSIKLFNPSIVIIPNLWKTSGLKYAMFSKEENKKVILFHSEGLEYGNKFLQIKYPKERLKYVDKIFLWSHLEIEYFKSINLSNITSLIGSPKYSNLKNKKKLNNKLSKYNVLFIISNRYVASAMTKNLLKIIEDRAHDNIDSSDISTKEFIHYEIDFLFLLSKLVRAISNRGHNVLIKPHPMESKEAKQ